MDLTPAGNGRRSTLDSGRAVFHVSPGKQQAIGVKYDTVAVREMTKTVRAVGNVSYDERRVAIVNLRYSGWIDTVAADFNGKFVGKGELLFRIYSPAGGRRPERTPPFARVRFRHVMDRRWAPRRRRARFGDARQAQVPRFQ